jgi:C4-dicarboxylate-specific signal transduction histidine kinase
MRCSRRARRLASEARARRSALESLGSNRLSAMAPVTGRPRALIRRERHDNDIDSGRSARYRRGVHASDLDRMFSAFFTTEPGGMGLGLVDYQAHDGRLLTTPNAPRGAIFQLSLPAA